MKQKAFTLAEVLITLGIIGILAVILVTVIQKADTSQHYAAFREFYSIYTNAQNLVNQNDGGFVKPLNSATDRDNLDLLEKYIRFQKKCYWLTTPGANNSAKGCWYYDIDANPPYGASNNCAGNFFQCFGGENVYGNGVILNNGMLLTLADATMIVDTNGFAKPNTPGKDVWILLWDDNLNRFKPTIYSGIDSSKPLLGN